MPRVSCYRCPHCQKLFETKGAYKDHLWDVLTEEVEILNLCLVDAQPMGIHITNVYDPFMNNKKFNVIDKNDLMRGSEDI